MGLFSNLVLPLTQKPRVCAVVLLDVKNANGTEPQFQNPASAQRNRHALYQRLLSDQRGEVNLSSANR